MIFLSIFFTMLIICLFRENENAKRGRFSIDETMSSAEFEMVGELQKWIQDGEYNNPEMRGAESDALR